MRANGHDLRWMIDPQSYLGEDTLASATYAGRKIERYGDWSGWPWADSTRGYWFRCYRGIEEIYRPRGVDPFEGWDVTTIQSNSYAQWPTALRERWTRLNLGQCLMGNGFFDGQGSREDYYFREYLREVRTGWQQYAPFWIPEMSLRLGQPDGNYHEYRPLPNVKPLYYRHFTRTVGTQTQRYTVVVNTWPVILAGVPRRDAMWFHGHLNEFPASPSLLVHDHWGDLLELPEWSVVHVGGGGLDLSIRFELPEGRRVALEVYDVAGRRVRTLADGPLDRGTWEFTWQGDDDGGRRAGTGVYLWRLTTGEQVQGGRWLLVR